MKELTKSELQYLIHKIKPLIEDLDSYKDYYKTLASHCWHKCDKETDPNSPQYDVLKRRLTEFQSAKTEQKKLALIQGKLKKLAST